LIIVFCLTTNIFPQVQFTPHTITTAADGARSVYAVDVDGDGDMDVISASWGDDKIAWYENDGNENFTPHTITTDVNAAYSVYAIDVDGDGDMDVLSASRNDDKIAWYENDGNENFTPHTITTDADVASSVYAIDVDGDGDIDVLSASLGDDKIAWYENDGNENFTPHTITTGTNCAHSVYAIDVDGDGDIDVFSASACDDKIAWYENDGNENFTSHTITTNTDCAGSVYVVDVDGDGDMDVLSASNCDDKIAWYENDGNENFTPHTITTSANGAFMVYAIDVDGDGDIDVLSASQLDDKIAWYENDGNENFTPHTITTSADGATSVYAIDVDGDGDIDVLSASNFDDKIAWYENLSGTVSIAYAIEDLDGDFIPDHLGETVTVEGVVFSPNFQTTNNSFYIWDEVTTSSSGASRGTDIFMFGPPVFDWQPGDLLQITGEVDQFNGHTEIIPADSTGWVFLSSGNPVPDPIVLTLAQYKADPEAYEGSLVGFISLTLVDGTWPTGGSSENLDFSDGVDTLTFRIDSDTDIGGQPEPVWPRDILGIGNQFDSSPPFDSGYQIFPRYYATDFLPPGTLPVELTSFTAQATDGVVNLSWTTATELNNQGFEIQRSTDGTYRPIGFVNGFGTTTDIHNYSFTDSDVQTGTYYYRLKQVDYNGIYDYSDVVQVDVAPVNFALEQNYPNPFNPSTIISYGIPVKSNVTLKVFDVLGNEVAILVNEEKPAGSYEVEFDASALPSGIYFYSIQTGRYVETKKMVLLK